MVFKVKPSLSESLDRLDVFYSSNFQELRLFCKNCFLENTPFGFGHTLKISVPETNFSLFEEVFFYLRISIAIQLQKSLEYDESLDWLRGIYDYALAAPEDNKEDRRKIYHRLNLESSSRSILELNKYDRETGKRSWLIDPINVHQISTERDNPYTQFILLSIIRCLLSYADSEFTLDKPKSINKANTLYETVQELLKDKALRHHFHEPGNSIGYSNVNVEYNIRFPISISPIVRVWHMYALNNLTKLRDGRNIAGVKRDLGLYATSTDLLSSFPNIGAIGQVYLARSILPPSVPYRYEFLIERTQQLVNIASQFEATLLSSLEKKDDQAYALRKARQEISLGRASVQLQGLRLRQSRDEVKLAQLQKKIAQKFNTVITMI